MSYARLSACMLIPHKGHTDTIQVYSVTVMTHVKALQAGHSSQGTSEPITGACPPPPTFCITFSNTGKFFLSLGWPLSHNLFSHCCPCGVGQHYMAIKKHISEKNDQ